MFHVEADNLLTTLWETLRPERPGYERRLRPDGDGYVTSEPGLITTLDFRLSHFALGGDEYRRSALVHTLFTANTSVFQAVSTEFDKWDKVPVKGYFNYSNHDSCWRSDGMRGFHHLFLKFAAAMNEEIVQDGYSALRPIEFHQFCTLGSLGSKPWEFVTVSHERIPGESHKRHVLEIERLSTVGRQVD